MSRQCRDGHRSGGGEVVTIRHDSRQPEPECVDTVSAHDQAQREFPGETGRLVQREDSASRTDDGSAPNQNLDSCSGHGCSG